MFATTHAINADLDKLEIRRKVLRRFSCRRIQRDAARCRGQAAIDAFVAELRVAIERTAELPILDAPRLRAGARIMICGGIIFALGLVGAGSLWLEPLEGLEAVVVQIATLCGLVGGVFLLATGRNLRHEPHLPMTVQDQDITKAQQLLDDTAESSRAPAGAYSKHIVAALMTFDAAVLLYLVAPLLLPETVPMGQLLLVAVGAFLVARISLEAIAAIAKSVRMAQVLKVHALKEAEGSPEALRCEVGLRKAFDGVMGANWPLNPRWTVHLPAVLWAVPLIGLQALLLGMRAMAGDDADITAALTIAGAIALLTTVFAVRTAINAECLTPEIANAKRLLGRFPTVQQLQVTLDDDWRSLSQEVARAFGEVVRAVQPRVHGVKGVTVPPLALAIPASKRTGDASVHSIAQRQDRRPAGTSAPDQSRETDGD